MRDFSRDNPTFGQTQIKKVMTKKVVQFGLAAGFINLVLGYAFSSVWMEDMDFSTGEVLGYVSMLAALTMVFVGVKNYRDRLLNGSITFGKALGVGVLMVLVASVIYVIGWMIYYNYFMPDFPEKFLSYSIEQINNSQDYTTEQKETQIASMKSWMESYKNPLVMMGFTFLEFFPIGFLVALISAWLLSRKNLI